MADLDINNAMGVTDRQIGRGQTGNHRSPEINNVTSINAMKTRLNAISATKYTAARLNTMTENDMLYAIRLEADATSI